MAEKISYKGRVLQYMTECGSITQLEATEHIGTTRLAAVIFNLKKDGYKIKTVTESAKNRWGDSVSYARYSLAE